MPHDVTTPCPCRRRWLHLALLCVVAVVAAGCRSEGAAQPVDPNTGAAESPSPPTGADEDLLGTIQRRGFVRIGIANEVPFAYEHAGRATGQAPEVARAVLERMGLGEVRHTVVEYGALVPSLQDGDVDLLAAGMYATAELAEQALLSDPDYCSAVVFVVPEGNPLELRDFASVAAAGASLGVLGGSPEEGYASASGVRDQDMVRFPDVSGLLDGLIAGRVDAAAATDVAVAANQDLLTDVDTTDAFVPELDGAAQLLCGAYAFTDPGFRDAFNDTLSEMKERGEILAILEPFGFSEESVEAARDLTLEDLLAQTPT